MRLVPSRPSQAYNTSSQVRRVFCQEDCHTCGAVCKIMGTCNTCEDAESTTKILFLLDHAQIGTTSLTPIVRVQQPRAESSRRTTLLPAAPVISAAFYRATDTSVDSFLDPFIVRMALLCISSKHSLEIAYVRLSKQCLCGDPRAMPPAAVVPFRMLLHI